MNFSILKNKKIVFLVAVLLIGAFLLPGIAGAQDAVDPGALEVDCSTFDFGCKTGNLVLTLLASIQLFFGTLLNWVSQAAIWMIGLGTEIIKLPVVSEGFRISLSVVNLLFVLGIIIAAFRIILGIGEREAQKMVGLIVLAALLVNFSMLIAGFLLDISNVLTNFFISGGLNGESIGSAFAPQRFTTIVPDGVDVDWLNRFVGSLQVTILSIGLTAFALITMATVFIMALVRNMWVAFLLILMPLSWGAWGFPMLSKYHKEWWDNFIKWGVIYLPTATFFLWLAISTTALMSRADSPFTQGLPSIGEADSVGAKLMETLSTTGIQLLILGALIYGGLKVAASLGGTGSGIGLKMAGMAGSGAKKLAWGATKGTAGFAYRRSGTERAGKATSRLLGRGMNAVGLTGIGNTLMKAGSYDKQKERYQKGMYANQTNEAIKKELAGRMLNMDPAQRQALFDEAKKRDMLGDIPEEKVGAFAKMIKAANPGKEAKDIDDLKDLARAFPDMAPQITGQTKSEVLSKMDGKALGNLSKKQLEDSDTVLTLTRNQLTTAARASGEKEDTIQTSLTKILSESDSGLPELISKDLRALNASISDAREREKKAKTPEDALKARADLRVAITERAETVSELNPKNLSLTDQAKNALEKIKHLNANIGSTGSQVKPTKPKDGEEGK
ncbi:MAG: hypothetical protein COU11_03375 [Candidatus Harrisonbacteria bacterium CG10_big_fil_rev_8_21_14_0_10_49_15]|uniref:Uncharacterized protein n=1 Tax=Candidatus Harrisonbacteria bacterium CG10_big_fil_rev_8_21_14_0_10_49_15 TaxID=1974587 RepID=A0A2H0UKD3_9BACT|nr:MAG: hypothetical protein COU11_03375 [Candidatus Harrisonbacteria bacterium CG10_big_fil_rev_8_21_14_0_10_49_15]